MGKTTQIQTTPAAKIDDNTVQYTETKTVIEEKMITYSLADLKNKKSMIERAIESSESGFEKKTQEHDATITLLNSQLASIEAKIQEAKGLGLKEDVKT